VDDLHLLFDDAALPVGLVRQGAPEDHEIAIDLGELSVVLRAGVHWFTSLRGWLLGLTMLAKGVVDVAPDGGAILEEVIRLPSVGIS
jgi:hypothetical protein